MPTNPAFPPNTKIWSRPTTEKDASGVSVTAWAVSIVNNPAKYPMFATATNTFAGIPALARVEHHTWTYRNGVRITGDFRGVTVYEVLAGPVPQPDPFPVKPPPAPSPSPARAEGCDVSHYQGKPRWNEVAGSGIVFAMMKATEGTGVVDDTFVWDWPRAKAAGLLRGAYHFFRPTLDATAQAKFFLAHSVLASDPSELPPTIDLEVVDGVALDVICAKVSTWLDVVIAATGRRPLIYTSLSYWNALPVAARDALTKKADLWLARWGSPDPGPVNGWIWSFWQYSATGGIPGIDGDVDRDKFHGTLEDLHAYLTRGDHPPSPPVMIVPPVVAPPVLVVPEPDPAPVVVAPPAPAPPKSRIEILVASCITGISGAAHAVMQDWPLTLAILTVAIVIGVLVVLWVRKNAKYATLRG